VPATALEQFPDLWLIEKREVEAAGARRPGQRTSPATWWCNRPQHHL